MVDINKYLINFLNFINTAEFNWNSSFLYDWLQANWEIIVESEITEAFGQNIYLVPYGEGGDCNGNSSRVCLPEMTPTHCILVEQKDKRLFNYIEETTMQNNRKFFFEEFVSFDTWYNIHPPFHYVLCSDEDKKEYVFQYNKINFLLSEFKTQNQ